MVDRDLDAVGDGCHRRHAAIPNILCGARDSPARQLPEISSAGCSGSHQCIRSRSRILKRAVSLGVLDLHNYQIQILGHVHHSHGNAIHLPSNGRRENGPRVLDATPGLSGPRG